MKETNQQLTTKNESVTNKNSKQQQVLRDEKGLIWCIIPLVRRTEKQKGANKEKSLDETRLPAKVIRREQCPVIVEETKSRRASEEWTGGGDQDRHVREEE